MTFCPKAGRPFLDKPRVYLSAEQFAAQRDNAFRLLLHDSGLTVEARWGGDTHQLRAEADLVYTSPRVEALLDPTSGRLREASPRGVWREADRLDLFPCAVMVAIARGLPSQLPHLVTRAADRE